VAADQPRLHYTTVGSAHIASELDICDVIWCSYAIKMTYIADISVVMYGDKRAFDIHAHCICEALCNGLQTVGWLEILKSLSVCYRQICTKKR
jgi:hypothetical protein